MFMRVGNLNSVFHLKSTSSSCNKMAKEPQRKMESRIDICFPHAVVFSSIAVVPTK